MQRKVIKDCSNIRLGRIIYDAVYPVHSGDFSVVIESFVDVRFDDPVRKPVDHMRLRKNPPIALVN